MGRTSGGGALHAVTVVKPGNPATATDISYALTAPGVFVSLFAELTTSATAANRFPGLLITDSAGAALFSVGSTNAQAASVVQTYTWANGVPATVSAAFGLPGPVGLALPAGAFIKTLTAGLSAGDQWSLVAITFQPTGAAEG